MTLHVIYEIARAGKSTRALQRVVSAFLGRLCDRGHPLRRDQTES